jgi:acyl-CoA synthetase (AMP-forming)/AMP-acid ligase II
MTARQIEGEFETVVDVLRAGAVVNADVEAYVEPATETSPRRSVTFAEWDRAADGVARLFAAHGVTRGSVVCLLVPSSIDYMVCYAAATRLGAVTSGVNLRLGADEVRSILDRTHPVLTVVDDDSPPPDGPTGAVIERSEAATAATDPTPGPRPALVGSDPVAVVWTSGTTGLPKGAVFDHRNRAAVASGTDVRPRGVDDPHLGRDRPRGDHRHHPHPLAGG